MKKPDELALIERLKTENATDPGAAWRIGISLNIPVKRLLGILYKWTDRDWLDYGTSPHGAWLRPEFFEENK